MPRFVQKRSRFRQALALRQIKPPMDCERMVQERTEALERSNALLDEVGELARIGGWELDLKDNTLTWSRMVQVIHEVEPGFTPDLASGINFYAPEAVPIISEAVRRAIELAQPWDLELPLITAKGNRIWVRAIGRAYVENHHTVKLGGVFQDITARHTAEAKLRQLALVVEESPASIVITDTQGIIEYANPKVSQLTGYGFEEALGQNPRIFKSGELPQKVHQEMWATITAGLEWRGEFHNKKKNGELFWESALISPLRDRQGVITNFIAIKEDITEKKKLEAQRETLIASLQEALEAIRTLRTLLPICASCKKIRDEAGYWSQVENYLSTHNDLKFTHGICPDCAKIYFPQGQR